jgi:hypothetical protein
VEHAAAGAGFREARVSGWWFGPLACGACGASIDSQQAVRYEYLLDGVVETVTVPAGGSLAPSVGLWPIARFHVACHERMMSSPGLDEGIRYVGCCPLSHRTIVSPRPLRHCPMCASPLEMTRTDALIEHVA